ncbi:hypothetical protein ACIBL6_13970 [Streptomyces sp. NPDC050400]|uniref:hypothetical protein n=1 Tax=Streptomyces sp. NPDC050400 TaxID=3365610 RepID=UPI0037A7116A
MTDQRLDELSREIDRISDLVGERSPSAADAIRAFNDATGHAYTAFDFATSCSSRDVEEFALEAARPAFPRVADVTREELIEIVGRVLANTAAHDYYLLLLEVNLPHPAVSGLIYHPGDAFQGRQDATAEEIVDKALSYRPIAL